MAGPVRAASQMPVMAAGASVAEPRRWRHIDAGFARSGGVLTSAPSPMRTASWSADYGWGSGKYPGTSAWGESR